MLSYTATTAFAPSVPIASRGSTTARPLRAASPTRPLARRTRTAPPCMILKQIRSKAASFMQNLSPTDPSSKPLTNQPLLGMRSVVLVTGANGKLGSAVVQALLDSGAATRVLAHIAPQSEPLSWDKDRVFVVRADLGTEEGVGEVASAATNAGVGSVVFAASGGPPACGAVDNAGVRRLAEQLVPELGERPSGDFVPVFDFA
eukprot:IDg10398t1